MSSDLVVISASKDCTIRSWLYAQEQAFSVIKIGDKVFVDGDNHCTTTTTTTTILLLLLLLLLLLYFYY